MQTQPISAEAMTRAVVGRVINAISTSDWAALRAVVAEEMLYWRPGTRDRVDGANAYVEQWASLARHPASLRYTPHSVIIDGDIGVVEATARATMADGHSTSFSLVTVMRVEAGKLVEEREYIVERDSE